MWITARDASPACFQLFFFPANNNKCLEWDSCLQALTEQNGSCGIKANEKYCVDASVYHNLFINLLILLLSAFRAIASHLHSILLLLLLDMKRKYTNALRSATIQKLQFMNGFWSSGELFGCRLARSAVQLLLLRQSQLLSARIDTIDTGSAPCDRIVDNRGKDHRWRSSPISFQMAVCACIMLPSKPSHAFASRSSTSASTLSIDNWLN